MVVVVVVVVAAVPLYIDTGSKNGISSAVMCIALPVRLSCSVGWCVRGA